MVANREERGLGGEVLVSLDDSRHPVQVRNLSLEQMLTGGDPRSLGRVPEVVDLVLIENERTPELFECLFSADEIVRMRAADALEKVCRQSPDLVAPFTNRLLAEVSTSQQPSLQWHLAQILAELPLSLVDSKGAAEIVAGFLETSTDWIVQNRSPDALAKFTKGGTFPREQFIELATAKLNGEHRSVARRAEKLLRELR